MQKNYNKILIILSAKLLIGTLHIFRAIVAGGFSVAWMVGEDVGAQGRGVEMEIDLGGGDGFMAEHLLDGTQIGSPLEQMGGKGVAQSMGRNGALDSGLLGEPTHYLKDPLACEPATAPVEKQDILVARLDLEPRSVIHPYLDLLEGTIRDGDYALLVSLAGDREKSLMRIYT